MNGSFKNPKKQIPNSNRHTEHSRRANFNQLKLQSL